MRPVRGRRLPLLAFSVALLTASALSGCERNVDHADVRPPAIVEPTSEPGVNRIAMTERAVERIGIELVEVTDAGGELAAPDSALVYDATGNEWVYVSPAPHVFVRARVQVERFERGRMLMSRGPVAGTRVVTVGAAQLLGVEAGL